MINNMEICTLLAVYSKGTLSVTLSETDKKENKEYECSLADAMGSICRAIEKLRGLNWQLINSNSSVAAISGFADKWIFDGASSQTVHQFFFLFERKE